MPTSPDKCENGQKLNPKMSPFFLCRNGGWSCLNELLHSSKTALKDLLRKELSPINHKLGKLTNDSEEVKKSISFLAEKYDELLKQFQSINQKVLSQSQTINTLKQNLTDVQTCASDAKFQTDELAQYLRRDSLEISGIETTDGCSSNNIVQAVGQVSK